MSNLKLTHHREPMENQPVRRCYAVGQSQWLQCWTRDAGCWVIQSISIWTEVRAFKEKCCANFNKITQLFYYFCVFNYLFMLLTAQFMYLIMCFCNFSKNSALILFSSNWSVKLGSHGRREGFEPVEASQTVPQRHQPSPSHLLHFSCNIHLHLSAVEL